MSAPASRPARSSTSLRQSTKRRPVGRGSRAVGTRRSRRAGADLGAVEAALSQVVGLGRCPRQYSEPVVGGGGSGSGYDTEGRRKQQGQAAIQPVPAVW